MKVTVSVPGKIILMGDHAVVHGAPALLAAVNMRMRVTVKEKSKAGHSGNLSIVTREPDTYVRQIVEVVQKQLGLSDLPPLAITIKSDIPPGYRLGSSAATAVGVTAALLYFLKKIWNPQRTNEIAYEAEKLQHGNPSGGDNTAVTFGGLLWYRKELEFLKSIWSLPFKPDPKLRHFFLIDTGRPVESTGEMVMGLGDRVKTDEGKYRGIFWRNEKETKRIAKALKEGLEDDLLNAIQEGEKTLEEMDVVSEKAKRLIRSIEQSGGAAKILGGGGKKDGVGFILAYHPELEKLNQAAVAIGKKPMAIRLGEEGLRLEEK